MQLKSVSPCLSFPRWLIPTDQMLLSIMGVGGLLLPLQQKTALQSLACPPRTPGIHTAAGWAGPKTHPYSIVPGGASRLATAQAALEATLGDVPFLGLSFNLQLENSGLQFWRSEC